MFNTETFRISAALKDLIGKELITDEFVAVFELVKNSFDANAKNVKIIFENNYDEINSKIIILDDGIGMNYKDLKSKWLFVAYSAKRLGKEYEDYRNKIKTNRVFAGAKGVGRFSCDRLGRFLNLISIKDEQNSKIENLVVNWEKFENADDSEFVNIEVTHNELSNTIHKINNGTVLEITGLRDEWNRSRILALKRSLVKLINPNQENDSNNFSIEIIANDEKAIDNLPLKNFSSRDDWERVNGPIRNSIFEKLEIKTSKIFVKITSDAKYIETTLQDRGDLIYCLKEENPFQNLHNINVYLFQLNRSAKYSFTKLMGMHSVEYGSVFMYKNGFRIYPYGEAGEDLLLIDRRKQQGYNRFLGTRDLIGRIEINGEQKELRETTSRDGGLRKTDTYRDLVEFFYDFVLRRLENYVVNIIKWGDEKIDRETKEVIRPVLWAKDVKIQILELISGHINSKGIIDIQYNKDFLKIIKEKQDKSINKILRNISKVAERSDNPELIKEAKKIEKAIRETKADAEIARNEAVDEKQLRKKTQQKLEYISGQNNFLIEEISDDTKNLESILHHIGLTTNIIKSDIANLIKATNQNSNKNELISIIKRISRQNQKISSFTKYFKKVNFDTISNKLEIDIVSFINEYIENVYKLREDLKLNRELPNFHLKMQPNSKFLLKFSPIDLIIVIDNLISNSYKNRIKNKQITPNIYLSWSDVRNNSITLSFLDEGKGIDDNIVENIFDFGFTTSRRGSGIGLYHIKEIIQKIKGEITVNNKTKKGVEFLIKFNK